MVVNCGFLHGTHQTKVNNNGTGTMAPCLVLSIIRQTLSSFLIKKYSNTNNALSNKKKFRQYTMSVLSGGLYGRLAFMLNMLFSFKNVKNLTCNYIINNYYEKINENDPE